MKIFAKYLMTLIAVLLFGVVPALGEEDPIEKAQNVLDDLGISFSGAIEIEAAYQETDTKNTSDITLATVELGVDAKPIKHVSGHIVFLFEEDDTDPVEIDQGYIRLDGEEKCPFYAEAGRLYLPFGNYDSHFISDPLTLELGETRESALVLGYGSDRFEFSLGIFNGEVNETDETDDMVDGFSAGAAYSMPPLAGVSLSAGVYYLSNVGDSDGLSGQLETADTITSYVPAAAAYVSANMNEILFCHLEYVAATDSFAAGDLQFNQDRDVEPWALDVEIAYAVTDQIVVGLRYGVTDDAGDFLPESLYGAVAGYAPMDHVDIALEIQTGEYADGSDITTATVQLALAF